MKDLEFVTLADKTGRTVIVRVQVDAAKIATAIGRRAVNGKGGTAKALGGGVIVTVVR